MKPVIHTIKHDMHFKDGTWIPKGSECMITASKENHHIVIISSTNNLNEERNYKTHILNLWRWFHEFDSISRADIDHLIIDGNNTSLYLLSECGNLEPDGRDEFGFPSKSLAMI